MSKAVAGLNTPNETRYFYPADDNWEMKQMPFKASTAVVQWAAIWIEISSNTTTWNVTLMWVENANGADFVWIAAETIATTDTDYATAWKLKGIWVPKHPYAKAYYAVSAWTQTAADKFKTVQIASTSLWLDVDTAWKGARIVDVLSSTRWICMFNLPTTETA